MRTRLTTGAVLAAAVALAGSALAAPSVAISSASVTGSTATVSGTAAFDGPGDGALGGNVTSAAPNRAAFGPAGAELKAASITPLPDDKGLRFTWQLTSLPASPPPEVVRYTWSFSTGTKTFQLQAKRSNVASTTAADDPAGHVSSAPTGAFQLRGNCGTFMGTPVSSCPHLQFLTGAFDSAKAQVTMDLPWGTQGIERGVVLTPFETATMSITAGFQAAVSNTTTSTYINDWATYYTSPQVALTTARRGQGQFADFGQPVAVAEDGTFTGTTPVRAGAQVAAVRACEGAVCEVAEADLS